MERGQIWFSGGQCLCEVFVGHHSQINTGARRLEGHKRLAGKERDGEGGGTHILHGRIPTQFMMYDVANRKWM